MERRVTERIAVNYPVTLTLIENKINGLEGRTINISKEGICLLTKKRLIPDKDLIITLPSENKYEVAIKSQIIWENYLPKENRFCCGVRFIEPAEDFFNLLTKTPEKDLSKLALQERKKIVFEPYSCGQSGVDLTIGCDYNCLYCHFSVWQEKSNAMFKNKIIDINPIYKMDKFPAIIFLSPSSDPFSINAQDTTHELLSFLLPRGIKFNICTKNIIPDRTINLLKKYPNQINVATGLTNIDDRRNELLEPDCPPARERLKVMKKYLANGLKTGVRLDPIFPVIDDSEESFGRLISSISDISCDIVIIAAYIFTFGRFKRKISTIPELKNSIEKLTEKSITKSVPPFSRGGLAYSLPKEEKEMGYSQLYAICKKYGLANFRVCGCKDIRLAETKYSLVCFPKFKHSRV